MASLFTFFNSSKLKLAHVNIRSCRNKEVEISLFLKENYIDILTLHETRLKNNFKLDIPNYTIMRKDRPSRQGAELLSLCVMILISLTRAPIKILIMKPSLFA